MAIFYKEDNKLKDIGFGFFLTTEWIRIIFLAPYYKRKFAKYRNRKYYLALDFDGTIVEDRFPDIGLRRDKVFKKLIFYHDMLEFIGVELVIILWTCRCGKYLDEAKEWMSIFLPTRIEPRYYNENPECGHGSPKVFAHEYWDDRGRRT